MWEGLLRPVAASGGARASRSDVADRRREMVGAAGFEPATSGSRNRPATAAAYPGDNARRALVRWWWLHCGAPAGVHRRLEVGALTRRCSRGFSPAPVDLLPALRRRTTLCARDATICPAPRRPYTSWLPARRRGHGDKLRRCLCHDKACRRRTSRSDACRRRAACQPGPDRARRVRRTTTGRTTVARRP